MCVKQGMEEILLKLGFKKYEEDITLLEDNHRADFHHWNAMFVKFGEGEEGKPWGCTVYTREDFPGIIRIDAAVAPNAVYGHLGMKKFQGLVAEKEDVLERLLYQVLQGHYRR